MEENKLNKIETEPPSEEYMKAADELLSLYINAFLELAK